jgi:CRISPR-associated protein Cas2
MQRHLFLVAYDISQASARARALKALKGFTVGGQKSLYECWLTHGELQQAMSTLRSLIDMDTDRVAFVQLDPRAAVHTLGVGVAPEDGDIFYLG